MIKIQCKECKQIFLSINSRKKFCSKQCFGRSCRTGSYKKCKICKKRIYVACWEKNKKYCSVYCHNIGQEVNYIEKKCKFCKKIFYYKKYTTKNGHRTFCSVKCLCRHNNKTMKPFKNKMFTKPELKFKSILEKLNIQFKMQKQIKYNETFKQYDFYISSKNVLVEIDGIYWHGKNIKVRNMDKTQLKTHKNDLIKNKLAKQSGFKLIRIWEDELNKTSIRNLLCNL